MPKLNVWKRLGIVLTGLWVAGSGVYWWLHASKCGPSTIFYCDFLIADPEGLPLSATLWSVAHALSLWRLGVAGNALSAVVLVPAFVWLAAFAAVHAARWVWAGRRVTN